MARALAGMALGDQDKPEYVQLLLAIRRLRHWSQTELARELCVHRSTIERWEQGIKEPHPGWMSVIRQLFKEST